MARREVCADLQAVRVLVRDALGRLDAELGGLDEYRLNVARSRLRQVDQVLVAAAGGLSRWTRLALSVGMSFPIAWGVAAATSAAGFTPGWVIATTAIVFLAVQPGLEWVRDRLAAAADRRRMARIPQAPRPFRVTVFVPGRLTEVPEPLLRARVQLVSAALRQVDSGLWRSAYLAHLVRNAPSVNRISHADMMICQAIDSLETYVEEQRVRQAG